MESKQSVAIVGSGLAGLVSAHLLYNDRQERYALKVFESVSVVPHLSNGMNGADSVGHLTVS